MKRYPYLPMVGKDEDIRKTNIGQMLVEHMRKHIDVAMEVAVYAFRYPVKKLVVKIYADSPKMTLYYEPDKEVLFTVELRQHLIELNRIDTYFGGPLEDFVKYIPM